MTDPRNGRHRAQGDALVEAHILIALQREVWAAKGLPGEARLREEIVVTDVETIGPDGEAPCIYDPLAEVAAVVVNPDLTIGDVFHSYVSTPKMTREEWDESWIKRHSSLRLEDLAGAPTAFGVGVRLRSFHRRSLWTSYKQDFDFPRLDLHCQHRPRKAPCLLVSTPETFRLVMKETGCEQFWPGHEQRPRMSADLAVQVLRERGHEIPEWASE